MPKLPVLSGRELVKVLRRAGFEFHHQEGSHMILKQQEPPYFRISVPDHRTIKRGLLRGIIREAGLSREEFERLLEK